MRGWYVVVAVLLVEVTSGDEGDLDSLIAGVFGKPGEDPPPVDTGDGNREGQPHLPDAAAQQPPGGLLPDGKCECVPFYLCENNTILTDGTGLIDIRFQEGGCPGYMEICCAAPLPPDQPVTPPPKVRQGCGYRNADGVGFRITGNYDNEAQYGEFPWMVAIMLEDLVEEGHMLNIYQCGGSLIHPSVVLTAAHCVVSKNPNKLKARAGEWDTQTTNELYPHQDRKVTQVVVHEKYHAGALYNDIALLFLQEPFDYAGNLDVVCLPRQGDVVLSPDCLASGWGKDNYGKEGDYQVILKKVELPMVNRDVCLKELRKTRLGVNFRLHDSFVCAGGEKGKDTCKGDGGSPLVCPVPGKEYQYQQVGIVAWGIGCGNTTPAVYVNVALFTDWIDKQMRRFNFKPDYYY